MGKKIFLGKKNFWVKKIQGKKFFWVKLTHKKNILNKFNRRFIIQGGIFGYMTF